MHNEFPSVLLNVLSVDLVPILSKQLLWNERFATEAAKELEVKLTESIAEPEPYIIRKSLLKSAFVHGKHKVQVNSDDLRLWGPTSVRIFSYA